MGNQLELNKGDNFIFAIDVSRSMGTTDCPGGLSRIDSLKEAVRVFIGEAGKYDDDGIDVLTFGATVKHVGKGVTPANAADIITPLQANESATDTASVIRKAYDLHVGGKYEQTVLFIATDGEPSDESAVFKTIADITQRVKEEHEFNISFLTVGERTVHLEQFLTKLDDDLPGAKYDIVDVKKLSDVNFLEAFDGALHD